MFGKSTEYRIPTTPEQEAMKWARYWVLRRLRPCPFREPMRRPHKDFEITYDNIGWRPCLAILFILFCAAPAFAQVTCTTMGQVVICNGPNGQQSVTTQMGQGQTYTYGSPAMPLPPLPTLVLPPPPPPPPLPWGLP